jgi:hypothetical protein
MSINNLPVLTALELERHIPIAEAAQIKGISIDTFKRRFPQLIRRVSTRRIAVRVRDLLSTDSTA